MDVTNKYDERLVDTVISLSTPLSRLITSFTSAERAEGVEGIQKLYEHELDKAIAHSILSGNVPELALLYEAMRKKNCEYGQLPERRVAYLLCRSKLIIWASQASEDGEVLLPDLLIELDKLEGKWEE